VNSKNQLLLKYDWYDPNSKTGKNHIGAPGTNFSFADIKFNTLGVGYAYYFNSQTKIIFYYEIVKNEITQLAGFNMDQKDDVFTCRLQFRF
jgi:predicted porin